MTTTLALGEFPISTHSRSLDTGQALQRGATSGFDGHGVDPHFAQWVASCIDSVVTNIAQRKWHIVVADDDADWRALMLSAVTSAGCSVTAVDDGLQLLAECRRMLDSTDRSLLVLSDLEMPGLSGMEAMAALPELGSRVQVVLITGVSAREQLARADASGAVAVLRKPVSRRTLLDAVARVLS